MIRVLMITASASYGGGPQHVFDLVKNFRKKILVDIACPQQHPFFELYKNKIDGKLIKIPERRFNLKNALLILRHTKKNTVTIIHSHGKGASVYGRFVSVISGIPHIYTHHGIHISQYKLPMRLLYFIFEFLTSWIDKINIFVSVSEYKFALKNKIARKTKSIIISNGVKNQVISQGRYTRRNTLRSHFKVEKNEVVVATLGRFDYPKNMEEVVQIASIAKNLRFLLIGNGIYFNKIEYFIKKKKIHNIWLSGFVDNPLDYLAAADIYLSTSRWEGLPLAVLQAMSLGLPVVASDVNGNRDLIQHQITGYLYPLGNVRLAKKYLEKLNASVSTRKKIGNRGQALQRECFNIQRMVTRTFKLYKSII